LSLQTEHGNALSQELFDAIVDPTRRSIIELLATNGQMFATQIYDRFDMTNPAVSQHLKVLRQAQLVRIEKQAQKHLYSLNPNAMHSLEAWIRHNTDLWDERFERLDTLLEAEKRKTRKRR
jgi:DNA-binding transcriptional ArsR family regulator